jgi:hypothetical protein
MSNQQAASMPTTMTMKADPVDSFQPSGGDHANGQKDAIGTRELSE